ncbi:hypothetical protein GA0070558_11389 [Micromonospora haikouensis]|uniref:Uncharacterized protein n=1 Tax=Micromonospora haikouensis TaxID=686309 RepID=A0A1C4W541_9ACTN|nr:hypothetical protein GA0070558_11389 [Micromonospora haikouensis]
MISGPMATPRPKKACIQFMWRGPNALAAYALSPESIAPEPSPSSSAQPVVTASPGLDAYPVSARLASRVLPASSRPTPSRAREKPASTLAVRYPVVPAVSIRPTASVGTSKSARMDGQPTPSSPSGRPRLTKAR